MNKTTHSVLVRLSIPVAATVAAVALSATPAVAGKSDCPSGSFCVWDGTSYTGRIQRIATPGEVVDIRLSSTKSYFNNRSRRTWYQESPSGGSKICVPAAGSSASTPSGWQRSAGAVFLSSDPSC